MSMETAMIRLLELLESIDGNLACIAQAVADLEPSERFPHVVRVLNDDC